MSASEPESQNDAPSDATEGGEAKTHRTAVNIVVSDQHLSEGRYIRDEIDLPWYVRVWRKLRRQAIEVVLKENPLEDFPFDEEWAAFISALAPIAAATDRLTLHFMGDIWDPLAVRWHGAFADPPYEYAAVYKMRLIMEGHPRYFDAIAWLLRTFPNVEFVIYTGNHDQFLEWEEVRNLLLRRIAGHDAACRARIGFIGGEEDFRLIRDGVLYEHGMNAEPINAVPKESIHQPRFSNAKHPPTMEMNFAARVMSRLVCRIKDKNPLIGRVLTLWTLWKNAALHRPGWSLFTGLVLVAETAWIFLAFWKQGWLRNIGLIWQSIWSAFTGSPLDKYAEKLFKRFPEVKTVVLGHVHEWKSLSTEHGKYLNTGTWSVTYDIVEATLPRTWKRWKLLEMPAKAFKHFLTTGELHFATKLTHIIGFLGMCAAMIVFLAESFPGKEWVLFWGIGVADFKWLVGILLVLFVFSGLVRFFAVKPAIVVTRKFTFAKIVHDAEGNTHANIMEWVPEEDAVREL